MSSGDSMDPITQAIRSHFLILLLLVFISYGPLIAKDFILFSEIIGIYFLTYLGYFIIWKIMLRILDKIPFGRILNLMWMTLISLLLVSAILNKSEFVGILVLSLSMIAFISYDSIFFQWIKNEKMTFFSIIIPILFISIVSFLFFTFSEVGLGLTFLGTSLGLFLSFRHPTIEKKRFYFLVIIILFIMIPVLTWNIDYLKIIQFENIANVLKLNNVSWTAFGSPILYKYADVELSNINLQSDLYDQLGLVGFFGINFFPMLIFVYLLGYSNKATSELKRLFIRGTAFSLFAILVLNHLGQPLIEIPHPFASFSFTSVFIGSFLLISESLIRELPPVESI